MRFLKLASIFVAVNLIHNVRPISTTSAFNIMEQRGVSRKVTAHQQREGGGFVVRRPVGGQLSYVDPFLMLDHLGPVVYGPKEAVGAPDHPHRGFETVTYVLDGGFQHKDSQGNEGNLRAGWVQWMTAGSGVIHSEMPTNELFNEGGRMEGFQLWVNLPAKDKMIRPRYQDTPPEKIPKVKSADGKVEVVVIAGTGLGTPAVIETRSPIMYLDVRIQPGGEYEEQVPEAYNAFAYVYRGKGTFTLENVEVDMGQVIQLSKGNTLTVKATSEEVRFLLIGGTPLNEPVARYGPFVMNTQEQIRQAFTDYQSGRFGEIEGSEERYRMTAEGRRTQQSGGKWKEEL
eukprot:Colp12_sorted_trinity150504_noHs@35552